jgi:NAD-dependent deacetylase
MFIICFEGFQALKIPGVTPGRLFRDVSAVQVNESGRSHTGTPEDRLGLRIDAARLIVARARAVTVLTGAGISTDSGIPDYRGPQGVWTRNPEAQSTATLSAYLSDPEVRRLSWRQRVESPIWSAAPNPGHRALVDLERSGRLVALVTQNVDELHQLAGSDPDLVIELHGTARKVVCWGCGEVAPMEEALGRVRTGEEDPHCLHCGGVLKSATISFGQPLDAEQIRRAATAVAGSDLVLVVGSSLAVHPAAGLVPLAVRLGASVVIVNAEETPYDDVAAVVLRASISDMLPKLVSP